MVEALQNLFDSPVTVFDVEFYYSAFYSVRLLFEIAIMADSTEVENGYLIEQDLPSFESYNKKCRTSAWLCHTMGIPANECMNIFNKAEESEKVQN